MNFLDRIIQKEKNKEKWFYFLYVYMVCFFVQEEKLETSKTDAKIVDDFKKEEETTEKATEVNLIPVALGDVNVVKAEIKKEQTKAVDKELLQAYYSTPSSLFSYAQV